MPTLGYSIYGQIPGGEKISSRHSKIKQGHSQAIMTKPHNYSTSTHRFLALEQTVLQC
jgi:hypothetical protein